MPVSYILIGFILRWSDSKKKKSWRVHILFSFSQFYKNKLISSLLCVRVLVTVSLLSSMLARFFSCKSWQDKLHFHISSYLIYFLLFFSGLKTPSKKSKGHKAGIPRWWSFRRKKSPQFFTSLLRSSPFTARKWLQIVAQLAPNISFASSTLRFL